MPKKSKGGKKESSQFAKRYGGALGAGYPPDEAAAIAHGGSNKKVKEGLENFHKKFAQRHGK